MRLMLTGVSQSSTAILTVLLPVAVMMVQVKDDVHPHPVYLGLSQSSDRLA